jgi:hypothetical protein
VPNRIGLHFWTGKNLLYALTILVTLPTRILPAGDCFRGRKRMRRFNAWCLISFDTAVAAPVAGLIVSLML